MTKTASIHQENKFQGITPSMGLESLFLAVRGPYP